MVRVAQFVFIAVIMALPAVLQPVQYVYRSDSVSELATKQTVCN